ncbi:MAG: acyl carrier protein [Candidatus Chloroheliales bacterium]|nr:MAG: acyl carrier protein [Chloroflexota bacterium]
MDELYDRVYQKLRRLLAEQLGIELGNISRDSSLIEDLDAAPLELYDEVFPAIEHAFDVEISADEARGLQTVQDMVDYIVDKTEL